MKKIIVFASGGGSNFKQIHLNIQSGFINGEIVCLVSNDVSSGAFNYAEKNNIFTHSDISKSSLLKVLNYFTPDLIVLAGYIKYIEPEIINNYLNKIINIHPSILPAFGGKNFYGLRVHKAVYLSGVKITGCTIHFVDEKYDNGPIIFQKTVQVNNDDNINSISKKVLDLEHKYYSYVIKQFCEDKIIFKKNKAYIIN